MTLKTGDAIPEATLLVLGAEGPEPFETRQRFGTGRHVVFAMPGAFTSTCSALHLPNVVANIDAIRAKGADSVSVLAVNDPFVMNEWGRQNGAVQAGILMLADPEAAFVKQTGLMFSAPPRGLIDRSVRYSMIVQDGVVEKLNVEEARASCAISGGETILEQL